MRAVEVRLNTEMGRLEALYDKESKLWQEVKVRYEENVASSTNKISNLKSALEEMQTCTEMKTKCIKMLLETKRDRFSEQLQAALNRGWAEWAKQAAELHTYRADRENQQKDDKGFYKLNEESIATVREDLMQD